MWRRSLGALNDGAKHTFEGILRLVERRNSETAVDVKKVPLSMLDGWSTDADGSLRHASGKFFSVEGIEVRTDRGAVRRWTQPVIIQEEIGCLGLIVKDFDGVLHFLAQLKIEPGNINRVQVSPTLQATRSNFCQAHGGRKPLYLDYFRNAAPHQIIVDQLQSEHGSRFFRKRNRNMIIMATGGVEELDGFCWMTAGQLKALLCIDNLVNGPARSVLSLIDFGPPDAGRGLHSFGYLLSWLTGVKADSELVVRPYPLNKMTEWLVRDGEIVHRDGKFFRVAGVSVSIAGREVTSWDQPVIVPVQRYLCAFIIKEINGVPHFLVQAKLECGNYDGVELAPTVQCLTGTDGSSLFCNVPYFDYVTGAKPESVLYDSVQSEEGGRFYHDRNRYMLVRADGDFPAEEPPCHVWMTRRQLYGFLRFNNYVNAQARSLLAALPYTDKNWEKTWKKSTTPPLGCASIARRSLIPEFFASTRFNLAAIASRDRAKAVPLPFADRMDTGALAENRISGVRVLRASFGFPPLPAGNIRYSKEPGGLHRRPDAPGGSGS